MTLVFFTDRDLGLRVAEILKSSGLRVETHRSHFKPDCSDEEWLAEVGRRRWVALTHDARIRYKPNELAAVERHNVRLLVLIGKARFPDLATSFVHTYPRIATFLDREKSPFIAKVYRATPSDLEKNPEAPGRIERWWPSER